MYPCPPHEHTSTYIHACPTQKIHKQMVKKTCQLKYKKSKLPVQRDLLLSQPHSAERGRDLDCCTSLTMVPLGACDLVTVNVTTPGQKDFDVM